MNDNYIADLTPKEFEIFVKNILDNLKYDILSFNIVHNKILNANDGDYQIDVYAEFQVFGAVFKVLIECKKHKNSIKRDVVQLLYDKLRATGSQKGMIFSTSNFQEGAVLFAKDHGIALITLTDNKFVYNTRSLETQIKMPHSVYNKNSYVGLLKNGNTFYYIQKNNTEPLNEFLFNNK